jgi:hypothetical protein
MPAEVDAVLYCAPPEELTVAVAAVPGVDDDEEYGEGATKKNGATDRGKVHRQCLAGFVKNRTPSPSLPRSCLRKPEWLRSRFAFMFHLSAATLSLGK